MSEKNILSLTLERLAHFNLEGEVDLENAENKAFGGYSDVYHSYLREGWPKQHVSTGERSSTGVSLTPAQVAVKVLRLFGPVDPTIEKVCCFANERLYF